MKRISSGSVYEAKSGYSRAVVANGFVYVSATAATDESGDILGKGSFYAQTRAILEKMVPILDEAGSSMTLVVQTRVYTTDVSQWEEVGRAHGEAFPEERPAMSLVHVQPFLSSEMLVEIELVAAVR